MSIIFSLSEYYGVIWILELSLEEQSKIFLTQKIGKALAKKIKEQRKNSMPPKIQILPVNSKNDIDSPLKSKLNDIIQMHTKAIKKNKQQRRKTVKEHHSNSRTNLGSAPAHL